MQTVRAADTNEVVKLIFRESDNDRKVSVRRCGPGGGAAGPAGGPPALTAPPSAGDAPAREEAL